MKPFGGSPRGGGGVDCPTAPPPTPPPPLRALHDRSSPLGPPGFEKSVPMAGQMQSDNRSAIPRLPYQNPRVNHNPPFSEIRPRQDHHSENSPRKWCNSLLSRGALSLSLRGQCASISRRQGKGGMWRWARGV